MKTWLKARPEGKREHLVVVVHNHLWWPLARRLVRVVDFSDGTYACGWRWSKKAWHVS